jgi:hypothetical protein
MIAPSKKKLLYHCTTLVVSSVPDFLTLPMYLEY